MDNVNLKIRGELAPGRKVLIEGIEVPQITWRKTSDGRIRLLCLTDDDDCDFVIYLDMIYDDCFIGAGIRAIKNGNKYIFRMSERIAMMLAPQLFKLK